MKTIEFQDEEVKISTVSAQSKVPDLSESEHSKTSPSKDVLSRQEVHSKASPSKDVLSRQEYEQNQILRAVADITLNLELGADSSDDLFEIIHSRINVSKNCSLFGTEDSYDHDIGATKEVKVDTFFPGLHHYNFHDKVGIKDFDQDNSGFILVFRLPSRKNKTGIFSLSFSKGQLFRKTGDSYYAALFRPILVQSDDFSLTNDLFSSDDLENLNCTSTSTTYSILLRSTRRAVNTLKIDIAKTLPSVVNAKGIELVTYTLERPKDVAEVKSVPIDVGNNIHDVQTFKTSSTVESLSSGIGSNFSSSTFTGSSTGIYSEEVVGKGIINVPNKKEKREEEEEEEEEEWKVVIENRVVNPDDSYHLTESGTMETPNEDTEVVMVSISVAVMKLLALHIVHFDSCDDPKMVVITNKDHLVVCHGVFHSIISKPLVPLRGKLCHNESSSLRLHLG